MSGKTDVDLPGDNDEFVPYTESFERRFFNEASQVTVTVTLMQDTWDDIQSLLDENDWEQNEGLLVLLTTGMAFLRAERALAASAGSAGPRDAEVRKLLKRLIGIESRFAAMKSFAFSMMRDHQAMELKYVAVERTGISNQALSDRLRAENEMLKAEIERLKRETHSQPSEPVTAAPESNEAVRDQRSRRQRLLDFLSEKVSTR